MTVKKLNTLTKLSYLRPPYQLRVIVKVKNSLRFNLIIGYSSECLVLKHLII